MATGVRSKSSVAWRIVGLWVTGLAVMAAGIGCGGKGGQAKPQQAKTVIQVCGSDTMVNLAQEWAQEYRKARPDVSVEVSGGGSGVGINNLMKGLISIANASRDMTAGEKQQAKTNTGKDVVETIVAYDAIALYVHKDNPIEQVTMPDLKEVYIEGGKITKWSQLGVKLPEGSDQIICVSRQNSSGTYQFFREHVLSKKDFRMGMQSMSGSKDVVDLVSKTLGGIGYSGMGYKTDAVRFVPVAAKKGEKAYMPAIESVREKTYPLARSLQMYTLGEPTGEIKAYIDWTLSPAGQAIVKKAGYIPMEAMKAPATPAAATPAAATAPTTAATK